MSRRGPQVSGPVLEPAPSPVLVQLRLSARTASAPPRGVVAVLLRPERPPGGRGGVRHLWRRAGRRGRVAGRRRGCWVISLSPSLYDGPPIASKVADVAAPATTSPPSAPLLLALVVLRGGQVGRGSRVESVALLVQAVSSVLDTSRSSLVRNEMLSRPVWPTSPTAAMVMVPVAALGPDWLRRKTPPKAPGRVLVARGVAGLGEVELLEVRAGTEDAVLRPLERRGVRGLRGGGRVEGGGAPLWTGRPPGLEGRAVSVQVRDECVPTVSLGAAAVASVPSCGGSAAPQAPCPWSGRSCRWDGTGRRSCWGPCPAGRRATDVLDEPDVAILVVLDPFASAAGPRASGGWPCRRPGRRSRRQDSEIPTRSATDSAVGEQLVGERVPGDAVDRRVGVAGLSTSDARLTRLVGSVWVEIVYG